MKMRSVTQASLTSGGGGTTQDFTVSGFGTATAWVVSVCDTTDGALIGMGFGHFNGVGVENNWAGAAALDNTTANGIWAVDFDSQFEAQSLNHLGTPIATEPLEAIGSLITDGVRLTYTTKPTAALQVRVDLIQCTAAHVANHNTAAGGTYSGASFQGNVLFVAHTGGLASQVNWRPCFGFVAEKLDTTITQCCQISGAVTNNNPPAKPSQHIDTTRFLGFTNATPVKTSWSFTAFTSNGFTFADSEGTANIVFNFLLLLDEDREAWCGALTTPTTAITSTYTAPGFSAGMGFLIPTFANTADTTLQTGNNGSLGIGSWNSFEQSCHAVSVEDAAATTNTSSVVDTTRAMVVKNDSGTVTIQGVVSPNASGFEVAYSAVSGTARYFLAIVFASEDVFEAVDETEEIREEVAILARFPVEETLNITEEVVFAFVNFVMDSDPAGEGGFPGSVQGEGGFPYVETGE